MRQVDPMRDIAYAKRFLNGESVHVLNAEAGFKSVSRMGQLIANIVRRSSQAARKAGWDRDRVEPLFDPPTKLLKNKDDVLKALELFENELKK